MVHLRIVVPGHSSDQALALLKATHSVFNIIYLAGAAQKPEGDVILCDVAREDASVVIEDLQELEIDREGSIAIEDIDSQISLASELAEKAAEGLPSDAVVWEEVEARTSENIELSASFLVFMVLSCLLAAVAIILDSAILLVGAMVVGPEFGPIAALSVAVVHRRWSKAKRSLLPLAVGFPVAIAAAYVFTLGIEAIGLPPGDFSASEHPNTQFISHPDGFSFIVAVLAGAAGVLSLTTAKSGALVGVLISVATIPAAANIAVAAAYTDGEEWVGAMEQLALNLAAIVLAGVVTLFIQRKLYQRRRVEHLHDEAREAAGLPVGRSRKAGVPEVESQSAPAPRDR
jgi:uncharacterized hydrophobic protein (TIGR00271 family)